MSANTDTQQQQQAIREHLMHNGRPITWAPKKEDDPMYDDHRRQHRLVSYEKAKRPDFDLLYDKNGLLLVTDARRCELTDQ